MFLSDERLGVREPAGADDACGRQGVLVPDGNGERGGHAHCSLPRTQLRLQAEWHPPVGRVRPVPRHLPDVGDAPTVPWDLAAALPC